MDSFKVIKEISIDLVGRLYTKDGRIFRCINDEYVDDVKEAFSSGLIKTLIEEKLLINSWISDVKIKDYKLVVEHEKVNHWNHFYEWSFSMMKDAAIAILKIMKITEKYGFYLKDPHNQNVVFVYNKPMYTDFGSIIKGKVNKASFCEFYYDLFLNAVMLSNNYISFARSELPFACLSKKDCYYRLLYGSFYKIAYFASKVFMKGFNSNIKLLNYITKRVYNYDRLIKKLKKLKPNWKKTIWSDYHDELDISSNERFMYIFNAIKNMHDASSLIEIGANQGVFARYIAENTHISTIIATDFDETALDAAYINSNDKMLTLILDVKDEHDRSNVKSDIVLAMALTHHLIFTENMDIDSIFSALKKLTNKYLIVEFMPLGMHSGDYYPVLPPHYTLEWFSKKFQENFILIEDKLLAKNRHVFIGVLKPDSILEYVGKNCQ